MQYVGGGTFPREKESIGERERRWRTFQAKERMTVVLPGGATMSTIGDGESHNLMAV
uniref:Bm1281 n=1 Tax=Brugia malayi TaxID=6279 RepID=A0A1I9G1N1_BRUMA|nr:Bm1281 [Brugia malayi]